MEPSRVLTLSGNATTQRCPRVSSPSLPAAWSATPGKGPRVQTLDAARLKEGPIAWIRGNRHPPIEHVAQGAAREHAPATGLQFPKGGLEGPDTHFTQRGHELVDLLDEQRGRSPDIR
jgi:hypothetical protein